MVVEWRVTAAVVRHGLLEYSVVAKRQLDGIVLAEISDDLPELRRIYGAQAVLWAGAVHPRPITLVLKHCL